MPTTYNSPPRFNTFLRPCIHKDTKIVEPEMNNYCALFMTKTVLFNQKLHRASLQCFLFFIWRIFGFLVSLNNLGVYL